MVKHFLTKSTFEKTIFFQVHVFTLPLKKIQCKWALFALITLFFLYM